MRKPCVMRKPPMLKRFVLLALGPFSVGLVVNLFVARGAAAAVGKVTLSLEASGSIAPRGGLLPVDVIADIERGWHINAHQPTEPFLIVTEASLVLPPGITAEPLQYPKPDRKVFTFAQGKELLVYEGKLGLGTGLHIPAEFPGSRVRVQATLRYQACNDTTCLPPTTATAELLLPVSAEVVANPSASAARPLVATGGWSVEQWLAQRGLAFTLLAVTLLGIGLNLTPCVYPLISVTVAYFGTHAQGRSGRKLALACIYVLGIAMSFSALGVAAALSGGLFGAALQKPAVMVFIAGVMVALALSSFGLYQLQPPAALMQWAGGSTQGAAGAAFMGVTMGIVAAPCVGPLVLALLVAVGTRQDPLLGFALFFALACGMGLPYVVLAMAASSLTQLPRSGEWLVWIERLFGCILLAMAAYFIAPLLPRPVRDLLLPAVIAIAGIYLGFLDSSGRSLRVFRPLKQAVGVGAIALALWLGWPQPVESAIQWRELTPTTVDAARSAGRPAVVDFGADWCIPCVEMLRTTFIDPKVVRAATRFEMVKADITEESEPATKLLEQFQVRGVPTVLVFDALGNEVGRMVGYTSADELLEAMAKAG
ncbi:MAG: thioredoxin family protein [Deltaproteobacteria bacterium]|nr:thioredoxin family protein [Deltaproteobacteria bacterium]MBI3390122.1 thioredoxin family protein [Deltaproteobacteria bacterium]